MELHQIIRRNVPQGMLTFFTTATLISICLSSFLILSQPDLDSLSCKYACEIPYSSPPISRSFLQRDDLESLTDTGDEAWNNLTTANGGALWVRTADINEDDDKMGVEEWGITMFHALHCLQMMRSALAATEVRATNSHTQHQHDAGQQRGHMAHCLVYLAEVVMCQADSTLEPPTKTKLASGKVRTGVDGVGYLHQCQDTSLLWQAAELSNQIPREPWTWWPGQRLQDLIDIQGM